MSGRSRYGQVPLDRSPLNRGNIYIDVLDPLCYNRYDIVNRIISIRLDLSER